jgi:anti-anti-sigma factor
MRIIYYRIKNTKILKLDGDIEQHDLEVFEAITNATISKDEKLIVFDLSQITYINSLIISTIVRTIKKTKVFLYIGGNKNINEILNTVGLPRITTIYTDHSSLEKHCI